MTAAALRNDRYPSRTGAPAAITPRTDPVVYGDEPDPLDPELVLAYEEQGYLVLPAFLSPHYVADLDAELARIAADDAIKASPEAIVEPDSNALRSLFAVHRLDGLLGEFARDPMIVEVAHQLLGSDVYIHQSRANLKPGFRGREFYWHSDFETWHTEDGMPGMRAVSCSVSLTANHPWNGPLLAIAGSHQWFASCIGETPENHYQESLRRQEVGVPDDGTLVELVDRGRIDHCVGPPGTVVFFDCNLMHGSNGNITPEPRRNVFVVYNSVDNALEEPFSAPGRRPEFIASRTFDPV